MYPTQSRYLAAIVMLLSAVGVFLPPAVRGDGNRLVYLDEFCDPYWPGLHSPRLVTPQWVGEQGVDCVVTIGIDDMHEPEPYEAYLRPILDRLKQIDGRAPASVMTNRINPSHPHLQTWLEEGVSLETHTHDHPCPCLQDGDFARAKQTYDYCLDRLASVPNNQPVAFRFPCMDSQNTPSPRGYAEIFNSTTPEGNFLHISSSVMQQFTPSDESLPRELVEDPVLGDRFARYVPFESFVNKVENYPYPYVIGRLCWEFPVMVPDDWQGQNIQGNANPQTAADYLAGIDATVLKQGVANVTCHPTDWIGNRLLLQVVDKTIAKHGSRVKFLSFKECFERINRNLLAGHPLRADDGGDNGVRLIDLNNDGFLDVVIGNDDAQLTRVWLPDEQRWHESAFPIKIVTAQSGERANLGARFGVLSDDGFASVVVLNESVRGVWRFDGSDWVRKDEQLAGLTVDGSPLLSAVEGRDAGVRLRDADGDGVCEVIVGSATQRAVFKWDADENQWQAIAPLPEPIVDQQGRDAGLRFADLNQDGYDDLVFSNQDRHSVYLYSQNGLGWTHRVRQGPYAPDAIPMIVRDGTNNGAWFAEGHMWVQNEHTNGLPDGVDRRTFAQLLGRNDPQPHGPLESVRALQPRPGFTVELVASEPLVKDPVAFDWGADGRLWVVEMADYPLGIDGQGEPGGRVRFLEDTNGDGKYDRSTVFLKDLPFPTGVMAWRDGVLVSAAPDILFARDTDGDGRADERQVLYRGFVEGNQQHRVNGFTWGLDNWVHVANGDSGGQIKSLQSGKTLDISGHDLRIRPDDGDVDRQAGHTQFGRHRDDWGNWFGCNNSLPVRHYVLADQYLRRNPHARFPSVSNDIASTGNTQLFPISSVLSHFSGYSPPGPDDVHRFTSACSPVLYRDTLLGDEFYGDTFTCAPVHNIVHRRKLIPSGATYRSVRPDDEQRIEFLASRDSWFRPTQARTGPDGALWVCDMYRLVIEHPEWIDDQLEKEIDLRAGHEQGRIYRVFPAGAEPRPVPNLEQLDTPALVAALDSPNGWQRDTAQRLLVHRADTAAVAPLRELAHHGRLAVGRVHALCALDELDGLTVEVLTSALSDPHPGVRRHAIRLSESLLEHSNELAEQLLQLESDTDPLVRMQLAYSLGESPHAEAGAVLGRLAMSAGDDIYVRAAVFSSINESNLKATLAAVRKDEHRRTSDGGQVLGEMLQLVAAMGDDESIASAIALIGDDNDEQKFHLLAMLLSGIGADVSPDAPHLRLVAASIGDHRQQAAEVAADEDAGAASRVAAVRLLGQSHRWADASDIELLAELLAPFNSIDLQQAAVEALGRFDEPQAAKELLHMLPQLSPTVQSEALEQLLSRQQGAEIVLAELESDDRLLPQIGAAYRERLLIHDAESIRQRAQEIFGGNERDLQAIMDDYSTCLEADGEPARGELIFAKQCAACHRVGNVGFEVGPDLAALKDRSPKALLTAVVDPNQAVEDKYRNYLVVTLEGRSLSGIIVGESSTTVTLLAQNGKEEVILRSEVEELINSGTSLMPDGMEKLIDVDDMTDLLAYLRDLRPPPRVFDGNQPKAVEPDEHGALQLAATDCWIYGETLEFESKHGNLGFWNRESDYAEWLVNVPHSGTYEVVMEYACDNGSAGASFSLEIGDQQLTGKVAGTGTWDDYQTIRIDAATLEAGAQYVALRPSAAPGSYLLDLKALHLRPVAMASNKAAVGERSRTAAGDNQVTASAAFGRVECEGEYPHHLQGICTDEAGAIYWSFTTKLVKTDAAGKPLHQIEAPFHHGDLCFHNGSIYVAVNLGDFNNPQGNADSWVYVYKSDDLSVVAKHKVAEVFYGAGAIGCRDGRFYVAGGLPEGMQENFVYEYDADFQFVKQHVIASGYTHLGIQTADFSAGKWRFGCYGEPRTLLVTDADFHLEGRFEFDCALGIVGLKNGRFLSADGPLSPSSKCTGRAAIAVADSRSGLRVIVNR